MVKAYRPLSLEEALHIASGQIVTPLAGGTDLMVHHRSWSGLPPRFENPVLFIGHLEELRGLRREKDLLRIGASITLSTLMESGDVPPLLRASLQQIAGPSIRNRATIGGNVCNASPAADSMPALYVLNAQALLAGKGGTRTVPIEELVAGPGRTCLTGEELLTHLLLPDEPFDLFYFRKVGMRAAYSCAKLSIAAVARTKGGRVQEFRLALGAVAPTVIRSVEAENLAQGKSAQEMEALIPGIVDRYESLLNPIDDQRSTASYRRVSALRLVEFFLRRVLVPNLGESE
jgi:CO/xanthine dehydrogenase FAD-binding subunit